MVPWKAMEEKCVVEVSMEEKTRKANLSMLNLPRTQKATLTIMNT
jgi:hypothetical protein